jgi:hypothetical protein
MQGTREVVVKVAGDQVEAAQEVIRLMHPGTQVEQKTSAQMLAQVGGESGSGGVGGGWVKGSGSMPACMMEPHSMLVLPPDRLIPGSPTR